MNRAELLEMMCKMGKCPFNPKETMMVLKSQPNVMMSWGFHEPIMLGVKKSEHNGLAFKVTGRYHKGWVLITLDWSDTYIVNIINNKGEVLETIDQVYFDDLVDIIDSRVETK